MVANARLEDPRIYRPSYEGAARGQVKMLVNADVAAAGSSNTDAAPIYPGATLVTGADDTKGVIMQNGVNGDIYIIKVGTGADLKVYPPAGAAINGLTATTGAITVVDDVAFIIWQHTATQFYTLPLLPS